ncbi:PREDICTED: LOW QUALITY PROTEIN: uncharacterized protein C15orf39 homolog [Tinamus guttatus]|uniref:LOW QUALITY PROTEIN: uncharacterized protein C15orf39 homolog n=1 Tax=Tinamus guttatus TaxID=94827 RepID=UPI00052ECA6F|nr:PREDICTED: LOW QUALITY PROTEIN: uncharacterized protein C15orf39 homolog [Tinamus guttatus]
MDTELRATEERGVSGGHRKTVPGTSEGYVPRGATEARRQLPGPGFAFGPPDTVTHAEPPIEGRRALDKVASAFQPIGALDKVPRGTERHLETFAMAEPAYGLDLWSVARERDLPCPEKRKMSLALWESTRGAPGVPPAAPIPIANSPVCQAGKGEAPRVKEVARELGASPQLASPEGRRNDLQDGGEAAPLSPPMPVINNVFSLAPYRDYLEGPAEVPFTKDHEKAESLCRNAGSSPGSKDSSRALPEPGVPATSHVLPAGSSVGQSCTSMDGEGGPCSRRAPESHNPKLLPHDCLAKSGPSPQDGSAGESAPNEAVLDLSLKKRLARAGEPPGPAGHVMETSKGEDAAGHEKEPPRKAEVGEGAKAQPLPQLVEVGSGDKSNFQSSATFMFKKYKILKSLPPGAVPPRPAAGAPAAAPSGNVPAPPSPCASQQLHAKPRPSSSVLQVTCLNLQLPDISKPLLPGTPEAPRAPGEDNVSLPSLCEPPAQPSPCASPQPRAQPWPSSSVLQVTCLNLQLPDISKPLLPGTPEAPRAPGEDNVSLPSLCEPPAQQTSACQYFTALHASLCNVISCSVSGSSPELLQEWLRRTEPEEELREMPKSPPKPKNGSRLSEPQKPTKGKEIWLAFKDVAALLSKLLSQLETFMFTRKCPFPHVVRAGAIFIPIHVVKEKLFPKLPGASVDQVLQEHKVELRPTTLSEEKLLRDLELKSCTSRMLKLPNISPDLRTLHWHDSVKQQLGR